MSGEAVVVTVPIAAIAVAGPVLLAGAAIAGTALVAALAVKGIAAGVGAVIEQQAREARRRAAEERARLAQWQAFERQQRQAMEEARQRHEVIAQVQRRLMAVQLREPAVGPAVPASTGARAQGYVSPQSRLVAQREAATETLAAITAALESVPEVLRRHNSTPLPGLLKQLERLRRQLHDERQPLEPSRIGALKATAEHSLAVFLERVTAERDACAHRLDRADTALQRLLVLEQLAPANPQPLRVVRQALLPALAQGEVSAAVLDAVEHGLQAASQQAAEHLATSAVRPALADALLHHLQAMGYAVVQAFPAALGEGTADARVRIPGGDQVAITLDANARLRFNLMHERAAGETAPLSQDEQAQVRAQEQRWCQDLKTLVNRLVEDGFDSEVSFERRCTSIPTVVVERFHADQADAWTTGDEEAEDEEARRRRIREAEQRQPRRLP